jgi:solute:Na+ symporter, SSS family
MSALWEPYVYQYAIGGVVFGVGLIYGWRQGYLGWSGLGLRRLLMCVGGLAFFGLLQGYLQFAPMGVVKPTPRAGGGQGALGGGGLGQALDYAIMIGYFVMILLVGTLFSRKQKTTKDFFFGGQRFSWWLIAASLVATTIGSYSFVKYSEIAFTHGLASAQTYLNDWFWIPLLIFGWLPLLYFGRLTSVPEYFERRFGRRTRDAVTTLLLIYMIGSIGVNLYTMGRALEILLGWPVMASAVLVAAISAVYVTAGGQTSVIMTDLFQGLMLLAAGLLILWLGVDYLGGWGALWDGLPRAQRQAFSNFNENPEYSSVGIFWQDAMANSAMFYFVNQGILMRFMSARSVGEGRKAAVWLPLVLMPLAAIVVASGGWVGRALVEAGALPSDVNPKEVFFIASAFLAKPGVFGLIMAALTAALMSTVDTLVTAIAAVTVNDIYKPYIRPQATEAQQLRVARWASAGVMVVGVLLVPVFAGFKSIYAAHGAFTAAVTPPLVVALLFGVFWKRYTAPAAFWTLAGGALAVAASVVWPGLIDPFSQGVPAGEASGGWLAGADQHKFMRALFGLCASAAIGVVVTWATRPDGRSLAGLVWGTVPEALARYKGAPGEETEGPWALATLRAVTAPGEDEDVGEAGGRGAGGEKDMGEDVVRDKLFEPAWVSAALAAALGVTEGDILYVSDRRRWLGGLRSTHARVAGIRAGEAEGSDDTASLWLQPEATAKVVADPSRPWGVRARRLY